MSEANWSDTVKRPKNALVECWMKMAEAVAVAADRFRDEVCEQIKTDEEKNTVQTVFALMGKPLDQYVMLRLVEAQAYDDRMFPKSEFGQYLEVERNTTIKKTARRYWRAGKNGR